MKRLSTLQKFTIFIVSLCTLICIIAGIVVRNSYTQSIQQLATNPDTVAWPTSMEISDINYDLLLNADIIVRVSAKDIGTIINDNIRTVLTVHKVYKGEIKEGDIFYFWEPSFFAYDTLDGKPVFFGNTLTNIIQPNKEYIVFANERYTNESYKRFRKIPTYIPANYPLKEVDYSEAVSYFDTTSTSSTILNKEDIEAYKVKYLDILDNEINCISQRQADKFYALKERIFSKLGIDIKF